MKIFFNKIPLLLLIFLFFSSCSKFNMPDARKQPVNADDRVQRNIEEGRGLRLSKNNNGGNFSFASSNPLWRATLEKLDFMPLNNVDYAGGVIVTDWYSDVENNEEIKISVKFLTNEIRSDSLDITIFKKECNLNNKCKTSQIENTLNNEIKTSILKRAAQLSKENDGKKVN
ncbi:DUF3576 domain-containing protein [Candidatus Pelagibacter sp.]|nr:DUF3576 domain-containing protein [Candidatus Pelagibacter sp.]